jgi:apolipoprotein N-acyltransferase
MIVKLCLLGLATALLSFSYAPYPPFYLGWIGLAPWLIVVGVSRSSWAAFGWGWLGAVLFFTVNLSWIVRATVPGAIALVIYLSLFWGLAAAAIRMSGLLRPAGSSARPPMLRAVGAVLLVPAIWVAAEWLRATLFTGFPWLPLGQSQSPFTLMCQVADFAGTHGVTYWLVAMNVTLAWAVLNRRHAASLLPAGATLAVLLAGVAGYGAFRLNQDTLYPGPRILVVQPNDQHERGGAKTVTQEQQIAFHFGTTERALSRLPEGESVDLIVWSETVMPPLNPEVRHELREDAAGAFLSQIHEQIGSLALRYNAGIVTGAYYVGGWQPVDGKRTGTDIRNAVYVYRRDGSADPSRYDKIHLVPFGEFLPFEHSFPSLHRVFRYFAAYSVEYSIGGASPDALTVFELEPPGDGLWNEPVRFVTPICYEDVEAPLIARMFRPGGDGQKRADLILNVTNDGWFLGNQQAQHLQFAIFRSIENRVPTARADNTGISGFIDSSGRTYADSLLPVRTEGTLINRVMLDRRVAFYSRFGNVFAHACALLSSVLILMATLATARGRRATRN